MTDPEDLASEFESQRGRLRAIAARLLGSDADADDAVQETWLRLARVDASEILNLDAWLTTVISRISLDILRTPRARHERSWMVEPWRDEPVAAEADPADIAAVNDRITVALLLVLEQLTPVERVAFVLHDVLGHPFSEVALVLQKSPEAARQLASRARRRVRGAPEPAMADRRRSRRVVDAWLAAASSGNLTALLALLDERAVLRADFGSSEQVIEGADQIAAQAVLSARLAANSVVVLINGQPGVAAVVGDRVASLMAFGVDERGIHRLDVLADQNRIGGIDVTKRTHVL